LITPTQKVLKSVVSDGGAEALIQVGMQDAADIEAMLSQVDERAITYAADRGGELIGKRVLSDGTIIDNPSAKWAITDSTRDMLRVLVRQAITEGWSTDTLSRNVQDSHAFSESRADMIARTEIAKADVAGNLAGWRASGVVTGKQSIVGSEHDDDDECDDNADIGVIGIDDAFPSGDDGPPYHPRCVCDLIAVTDEETES